ncbi:TetR/AcrR family transcriptional regulator [Streptomyces sp. NBC_00963]|nr:TetR/AcrR family transcriptional regulator [Streptomyces sp. NBC_00963]
MAKPEVGHRTGSAERHRVDGGQATGQGEDPIDPSDGLFDVASAGSFADQLHACRTIVDEGCADPDPWRGLCLAIERICELHARDRGFTEAFLSTLPGAPDVAGREYTVKAVVGLARRAKDAGRLRPGFVLDDLFLVLMANKGIHATSTAAQVMASRRFAALAIQAFEACPHHAPLPPAARLASAAPAGARP